MPLSQAVRSGGSARSALLCGTFLLLPGLMACQSNPAAERRLSVRSERIHATAATWSGSEKARPERLRSSLEYIPPLIERQVASLERSGRHIEKAVQRDVQRWQDRQPVYFEEARRRLWGRPERIEPHAIILFF